MCMDGYHVTRFTPVANSLQALVPRAIIITGGSILSSVDFGEHFRVTGGALKNWFIAQLQDSLAVGLLWLIGLYIIRVPGAPLWALLGAVFQFVPQIGAVLGVIGPALTAMFKWGDWEHPLYVLMLYAVIAIVDGFLLQPYIMKRTAKVPVWASILAPIVLGMVIPFWGVLLAPPLLAVLYAYKARQARIPGLRYESHAIIFCSPAFI